MTGSSGSVTNSSFYIGIWEGSSQTMLSYTGRYEKEGTPIIGIEDLMALGQIVRPIKARIASTECATYSFGVSSGAVGRHEAFSPSSAQSIEREVSRR